MKMRYPIVLMVALLTPFIADAGQGKAVAESTWVLDMPNEPVLPHRFRMANQKLPRGAVVSEQGLHCLPMAGTAQFSEQALLVIASHFTPPFTIIDLRQESHGFINGNAVTWVNQQNNINQGKTAEQVKAAESRLLNHLKTWKHKIIRLTSKKDRTVFIDVPIKNIASEEEIAHKHHFAYQRFYVTDHFGPDRQTVDDFILFIKTLPPQTKLLFHCRGGAGRTTTFMAMFDMMHNAKTVSFEDILKRQYLLGGQNLVSLPAAGAYKYHPAQQRLAFLKMFYRYCVANKDNYATSWQNWLANEK